MLKSIIKTLILSLCIIVLSSGMALADTNNDEVAVGQSQVTEDESSLLVKQREIDQYLFEQYAEVIKDKGILVTYTCPTENYIEIGITPFNEANAQYLYNIFGREMVKVVEGQQAVLMTATASNASQLNSGQGGGVTNEEILNKQREIDQYVFEQHKDEIAQEGFTVTYTAPFEDYVEIGISPLNEANAEYLYNIFGREMVRVVEGQQAELMTEDNVASESEEVSGQFPSIIVTFGGILCIVTLLGITVGVIRRHKA